MREYFRDVARVWDELRLTPTDYRQVGDQVLVTGRVTARSPARTVAGSTGWVWRLVEGKVVYVRVYGSAEDAVRAVGASRLGPPAGPQQVVHLLLLAHDHVLEAVLHRLGGGLAPRGLDRRLHRLEHLGLASRSSRSSASAGSAVNRISATSVVGSPPIAVIFSTSRVSSSSSASAWSRILSA